MLRFTRVVMLLSVVVQAAAFVRTMIIAAEFGVSLDVDAYNLGTIAPTFISTVIGGWLQVAFVGKYAGLVATGKSGAASAYRTWMLTLVIVIAVVTAGNCVLLPDEIMALFLPTTEQGIASRAADALMVTGLILVPVIVADFIGLVLNSHGRFFAAAFAPLLNAVVSIAVLWFWPSADLAALVWSLVAGTVAQLAVVALSLLSMRLAFSFKESPARGEVAATIHIALLLLPAIMLSNSAAAILQLRTSELGEGAVAVLGYAMRFHNALAQIIVIGFGTVLLPHFASLWARREKDEIILLLRRLTRAGVPVCAYLLGGIYLMGTPTVSVLLKRGAFDADTAARVAELWVVLSFSLFPFALGTFIAKLCQAMRGSVVLLASSAVSFISIWGVSFLGAKAQSLPLIAASTTVAFSATTAFWLAWLAKSIRAKPILMDMLLAIVLTIPVIAPPLLFDFYLRGLTASLPLWLSVLLRGGGYTALAAGVAVATGFYRWTLMRETEPANVHIAR